MSNSKDIIIIGGGIVGLATALQLLRKNPSLSLTIIEKENKVAAHQTGHNSGVIHSGLYYKPSSLKAQNCLLGYKLLVEFCEQENIPFDLCGKIVVATREDEIPRLKDLHERGIANGLVNNKWIGPEEIKEIEPHCTGIAGLWVPYTGIVDYKAVSEKIAEILQTRFGAELHLGEKVIDIKRVDGLMEVITDKRAYLTKQIINCAGLYSDKVAKFTVPKLDVKILPFRGEYYELKPEKEYLVKNLIYPVPDPAFPFLGVHFTRMMGGGVEAGPNAVLAFAREGYTKSDINLKELGEALMWPGFQKIAAKYWQTGFGEFYRSYSKAAFTKALQRLIPELQANDLVHGEAGVRAQACHRKDGLIDDFMILQEPGVVNVCNAPSPAATSSLSIGLTVASLIQP
ncbi:L-2-hydroxyglutarate oxidase [Peijinzhouia sedimentorum]